MCWIGSGGSYFCVSLWTAKLSISPMDHILDNKLHRSLTDYYLLIDAPPVISQLVGNRHNRRPYTLLLFSRADNIFQKPHVES